MRTEFVINSEWKFKFGDIADAKSAEYDDSDWYDIGLPHTFSLPYFMENNFYVGYGCYRKKLKIEKEWLGSEISLIFGAAFQHAEVYVNGTLAGTHKGGYTAFRIPINDLVSEGENLIFVRLDNLWDAQAAPRAGEHVFSGGLYRDVSLQITERVHVGWNGTFVTTPEILSDCASVRVRTDIVNNSGKSVSCSLESEIFDGNTSVIKISEKRDIGANTNKFDAAGTIPSPKLWSPENPQMYKLVSRVFSDGELCDEYITYFGIRSIRFDKDEGFFLNGEHYWIWGANVHQDHAGWGDGITRAAVRRDVQMIKDCGMNFIRGSHYPHHRYFAESCDEIGLLFWSELCFWGTGGPSEEGYWTASGYPPNKEDQEGFEQHCFETLEEMVIQNRNSPSVIVWSMCNEPFFSDHHVQELACEFSKRLIDRCHELDESRPAALGGVQRGKFDLIGDIAGYNGDGATIYKHPNVPNLLSEYGSVVSDRPGKFIPNFGDHPEDVIPKFAWRSGRALWCAFHHGSILGDMGHMGMIDYARLPLRSWHWYRKELLGIEPPDERKDGVPYALTLTSDKTAIRADGTDDAFIVISLTDKDGNILSNTATVTLTVAEGGGILPTGRTMVFSAENKQFADGQGAVEFRTYFSGENRITAEADGLIPAEIIINGEFGAEWNNDAKKQKLPSPPPYISARPAVPRGTLISLHKPVFCSSFEDGYSANCLTEEGAGVWKAADDGAAWVQVDLEGTNTITAVEIRFAEPNNAPFNVLFSCNGELYNSLGGGRLIENKTLMRISLKPTQMRFLKVEFPAAGETQALSSIRIFS